MKFASLVATTVSEPPPPVNVPAPVQPVTVKVLLPVPPVRLAVPMPERAHVLSSDRQQGIGEREVGVPGRDDRVGSAAAGHRGTGGPGPAAHVEGVGTRPAGEVGHLEAAERQGLDRR